MAVYIAPGAVVDPRAELDDDVYVGPFSTVGPKVRIGAGTRLENSVTITGRVTLGRDNRIYPGATLSGGIGVHHFATIGKYSFVAGLSRVLHDVPPYMLADGSPARPRCLNVVALKRNNFATEAIAQLEEAYRLLYRAKVGLEPT